MGRFSIGAATALAFSIHATPLAAVEPSRPAASSSTSPAVGMPSTLGELLAEIKSAYGRGDYNRGLALVQRAFELEGTDVSSMDRIGSVYYVLGRYGEAITIWQRSLPLEHSPLRRRQLENSIAVARRSLGLAPPPTAGAPAAKPIRRRARKRADPRQVAKLYKSGIRYYAQGEYLQATTAFLRVLELDPENADAKRALKRLRLEPGPAP